MEKLFKYNENSTIRTIYDDAGEIWFVGIDVCNVLDYEKPTQAIEKLDEDERKLDLVKQGSGQRRRSWILNESGLYSLILTSTKPEAKAFKRWITHDVLPSIRKAGIYSTDKAQAKLVRLEEVRKLINIKKGKAFEAKQVVNEINAGIKELENEFDEIMNTNADQLKLFPKTEMDRLNVSNSDAN